MPSSAVARSVVAVLLLCTLMGYLALCQVDGPWRKLRRREEVKAFRDENTTATTTTASARDDDDKDDDNAPDLLLSVPFYVYEELAWVNATYCDSPMRPFKDGRYYKHSDDYWFLQASLRHPMRTHDPSEARLFVVGTLLNYYDRRIYEGSKHCNLCWRGMCNNDLLMDAGRFLNSSEWFRRYPERHIVVQSHYGANSIRWYKQSRKPKLLYDMLYQMNAIVFEKAEKRPINSPRRIKSPSYYVGTPCELSDKKTYDVAMIANLPDLNKKPLFRERADICRWTMDNSTNATSGITMPFCGPGEQCPTLAQSKFGFHARGDSFGSNRLMDTLLSGTVPIFTRMEQYPIQGPWIDWEKLSHYVPVNDTNQEEFLERLNKIVNDDEGYQRRHRAVLDNRQLFNWTLLYPFDTYMYMLQAELYPETRQSKSRWSALILPPTLTQ